MQERKPDARDKAPRKLRRPAQPARSRAPVPALSIDESFDEGGDPYNNTRPGVAPRYRKD